MELSVLEFLTLLGSLGFFIFGMKVMSEGIQKVSGSRMRQVLGNMTGTRLAGVGSGFLSTALVQSSSAITVMIVSFVNAGLLNLRQAIGVIMGANIGTSMTVWMIVILGFSPFAIYDYTLPILAFGLPLLFLNNKNLNNWGEVVIGFALVFMSLGLLNSTMALLNPDLLVSLERLADMGVLSVILFLFLGSILTIVLQSSSAALVLTLVLCVNGLPFELGAATILGENIGTTVTANLAALVGNISAKRAARAHFIFNAAGVIWMVLIFGGFLRSVDLLTQNWGLGSVFDPDDPQAIIYGLAIFHTSFNLITVLILVGLVPLIERVVIKLVPSRGDDTVFSLEYISTGLMGTPELSLLEAYKETSRFSTLTAKMNSMTLELLEESDSKKRKKLIEKIRKYEEITDRVEVEISNYLSKLSEGTISIRTSAKVRSLLSIANDLERIGDLYYQMSKRLERKNDNKIYFLPEQRENIKKMLLLLDEAFRLMTNNLSTESDKVQLEAAQLAEAEINALRDELRKKHLKNLEKGVYSVKSGLYYSDMFEFCEKVGDNIMSISEAYAGKV
ncbi:MAG: Na/Pi cotransporter family protein [Cryomorphaceae bacterium]|nr:MAG: Na/Pi cotransporter family protein [Cryomorphaceae bacterium]